MRRTIWTAAVATAVGASLLWSATGIAADGVPIVTDAKAQPKRFCAKRTSRCQAHVGTRISFKLSKPAKVYIDVIPRFGAPRYGFMEVHKRFPAGANSAHIRDARMDPGRWDVRIQGTGATGAGPISKIEVRVLKHG